MPQAVPLAATSASLAAATAPTGDPNFFGHPRGLAYLAFTEMWERFSYYGMTTLLALYMTKQLLLSIHARTRNQSRAVMRAGILSPPGSSGSGGERDQSGR